VPLLRVVVLSIRGVFTFYFLPWVHWPPGKRFFASSNFFLSDASAISYQDHLGSSDTPDFAVMRFGVFSATVPRGALTLF